MDAALPDGGAGDGLRAADVFVADLRPRPGGRLMQGVRLAGAALSELLLQLLPDEMERLDPDTFLEEWSARPRSS